MFGFKKKNYRQDTLPEISGEKHGIAVTFKNYPIRIEEGTPEKRVEYYPDFNLALIHAIWKEIPDFDNFAAKALQETVSLAIHVENAPAFACEVRLKKSKSKREFTGDLPDAVISAFESGKITR